MADHMDDIDDKRNVDSNGSQEAREFSETVDGVLITMSWESDYENGGKCPMIKLYQGNYPDTDYEEINLPSSMSEEEAKEMFEHALDNIKKVEGEPQRLYIAYGAVKQELRRREAAANQTEALRTETAEATLRAGLDKSLRAETDVEGQRLVLSWRNDFGPHGSYVIEFPGLKSYSLDHSHTSNGAFIEEPVVVVGARPDIAQRMFDRAIRLLTTKDGEKMPEKSVHRDIMELVEKYEKLNRDGRFWDQSEGPLNDAE